MISKSLCWGARLGGEKSGWVWLGLSSYFQRPPSRPNSARHTGPEVRVKSNRQSAPVSWRNLCCWPVQSSKSDSHYHHQTMPWRCHQTCPGMARLWTFLSTTLEDKCKPPHTNQKEIKDEDARVILPKTVVIWLSWQGLMRPFGCRMNRDMFSLFRSPYIAADLVCTRIGCFPLKKLNRLEKFYVIARSENKRQMMYVC